MRKKGRRWSKAIVESGLCQDPFIESFVEEMFYVQSVSCRYVEVMSGTVRAVGRLNVKNLEDSRVRSPEPQRVTELGARTPDQKTGSESQDKIECKDFQPQVEVIPDSADDR